MKKITALILVLILLMGSVFANISFSATAESEFYFKDTMSKEVLRNYVSRAVSHQCLIVSNNDIDLLFDEDMRMLRRIGAKYIGRAATYSWGGNMSKSQIDVHYKLAKEQAAKAHSLDPEMILQAGIFEIAYKSTVNNTSIPAYVFEAFGQPVVERNFKYEDVVFPEGTKDANGDNVGMGCWGTGSGSGVPDITKLETKMYFYYQITRYIDAGFEAFHMGQAEKMMRYKGNSLAHHWDELLTKARAYGKKHARRGVVLFDCHTAANSGGIKVGNKLVFDIQGAGLCPNETGIYDNAMQCEAVSYQDCWLSWIGRSDGGIHPLGFEVEHNFTILEFDNYGGNGKPGVATPDGFYNWGFDDITWFALQPEWYRNQFLLETDSYLKTHYLDSEGKQQYFLQAATLRNVTPEGDFVPRIIYTPGKQYSSEYIFDYATDDGSTLKFSSAQNKFLFEVHTDYRANRNSDICPNGFGQEDIIREIFLGENAPEDPNLLTSKLPDGYTPDSAGDKEPTDPSGDSGDSNSSDNSSLGGYYDSSYDEVIVEGDPGAQGVETKTIVKTTVKRIKAENGEVNIWILIGAGAAALVVGVTATFLIVWLILKKKKAKKIKAE